MNGIEDRDAAIDWIDSGGSSMKIIKKKLDTVRIVKNLFKRFT